MRSAVIPSGLALLPASRTSHRLVELADRLRRLAPSSRNPERFHEEKSEIVHALRLIAHEVAR